MNTVVIVILILAAFGLALTLKKYEHTLFYVVCCAAAVLFFLVEAIIKAHTGPTRNAFLLGCVTIGMLWRTVALAIRLKRTPKQEPIP